MHSLQGRVVYLRICSRAMDAAHRGKKEGKVRMNYVENAIKRALSEVGDRYEAKMYWLATITSPGAPFLGLLGTVWGIMDAFGTMDAGGATIEHLAPGVSGALLHPQLLLYVWQYQSFSSTMVC